MDDKNLLLQELVEKLEQKVESKKNDVIALSGAVRAAQDAVDEYQKFSVKSKNEFQELVASGQATTELGNFVLAWLGKGTETLTQFAKSVRSTYDIRCGEVLSIDSLLEELITMRSAEQHASQEESAKDDEIIVMDISPPVDAGVVEQVEQNEVKESPHDAEAVDVEIPVDVSFEAPETPVEPPKRGRKSAKERHGETLERLKKSRSRSKKQVT